MANQKIWTRNYDNLFSAGYGITNTSVGTVDPPTETIPLFRVFNGNGAYQKGLGAVRNRIMNLAATCMTNPSIYIDNNTSSMRIVNITGGTSTNVQLLFPWGICLGSGTDAPSYEDYDIKVPIRSNMTIGTVTQIADTYDSSTHKYTYGYKIPIAYSGSTPVSISEYGLYVPFNQNTSDYSNYSGTPMLVYHEVFEEAITLEQNDTIEITVTQTVTQPHYTPYTAQD